MTEIEKSSSFQQPIIVPIISNSMG